MFYIIIIFSPKSANWIIIYGIYTLTKTQLHVNKKMQNYHNYAM